MNDLGIPGMTVFARGRWSQGGVEVESDSRRWSAPPELRQKVIDKARPWLTDETVVRLRGIENSGEVLCLSVQPTGYFDYLATNHSLGPFTEPHLRADSPLANAVAVEVTLICRDGLTPIRRRASGMALLESCWQTSVGETAQLPQDLDIANRVSFFLTAYRGLQEELGAVAEEIISLSLLAIVAEADSACPGLLMIAETSLDSATVSERIAVDHWEHDRLEMIDLEKPGFEAGRLWSKRSLACLALASNKALCLDRVHFPKYQGIRSWT